MSKHDEIRMDQQQLAEAWQRTLPDTINEGDRATVLPDEADSKTLRVTIQSAGHQAYNFDFKVVYVDSREVKSTLIDVEKDGRTVDERTDIIQQLVHDYTRHIHECAQALHGLTHA
ncbi:hypothetical protein Back11_46470 [Paenibacillus baekrokdamisoli]|uniref:Uncharacterized protein n=1 Tax=Paenibacillus baekrokdamisoli TaxID=1712516 RepID=A0A3G9IY89_9BACL|nr:hypothetical protein [Paenibacillus baekrokdamisoli]MBB3073266.1 phosphoenolpyruvate carboxylase [Paenibacillus baekrokdamisoli]BBH23302.1 hypothetical protein Back11_46470 [Paenibacillus baekrokdamisoli]